MSSSTSESRVGHACPCCGSYAKSLSDLLRHVRLLHFGTPGFTTLKCNLEGCHRSFRRYAVFRNHIYEYHSNKLEDVSVPAVGEPDSLHCPGTLTEDSDDDPADSDFGSDLTTISQVTPADYMQRAAAIWLLKTQEVRRLPQSTTEGIMQDAGSLYDAALSNLHADVSDVLRKAGVDASIISGVTSLFTPNGPHGNLFSGLETHYRQLQYYKSHFHFVEPQQVVLGTCNKRRGTGAKRRLIEEKHTMAYIPILENIQALLHNDVVRKEIIDGHKDNSGYLSDFCDGEAFMSHPLFSHQRDAIQIMFYYDDLEICNPLGSKKSIHKIGVFYYLLGNLHPKYRSQLRNIQLAAIVKCRYIKKYSMDAVLKPIVDDVAKLEKGCPFIFDNHSVTLFGTIATISADNPASCALGGFKESTSAYRLCRQCMATHADAAVKFSEPDFMLRTLEEHLHHCTELETNEEASVEFGVNRKSVLTQLQFFDLCSGALIPDIMHDVLEGVLQYEAKLVLAHVISGCRCIRLSHLNHLIESVELGYMETSSQPSPIILNMEDRHLRQNASQMWLLGHLLPVLIGSSIPEDDERWKIFLLLLEIVDIFFARRITEDTPGVLHYLIEEHHTNFSLLYPDQSIIPKMHFLVHAPRIMMKFGPLICHWTMRFEAKNKYIKGLAVRLGNFINIPYTLSMRHQQFQCYYNLNAEVIARELETGPSDTVSTDILSELGLAVSVANQPYSIKWVKAEGLEYRKPCVLVVGVEDDDPVFARLEEIYVITSDVYFKVVMQSIVRYAAHFHAYVITPTSPKQYKLIKISDLFSPFRFIPELSTHSLLLVSMPLF